MTNSVVTFKLHRNKCKMDSEDIALYEKCRVKLSCNNPAARFSQWAPDIFCPISPTGYFKFGLFNEVIATLKKLNPLVEIKIDPKLKPMIKPIEFKPNDIEYFHGGEFEERDYQTLIIREALKCGRCIWESATGSGKSFIIYSIIRNLRKRSDKIENILILVPTIQLVKQMYRDFQDYGAPKDGIIQMFSSFDSELSDAPIIISNRQWLERHSDELPDIHAVIVDEVQQLSANNKVTKFIDSLDTQIRYGCSGTVPKDKITRWGIIGTIGPIIYSVRAHKMQEEGFISKIKINPFLFKYKDAPHWEITDDNYDKMHYIEYDFIENNEKILNFMAIFMSKLKGNSVILFDHTEHGHKLFDAIKSKHKGEVRFINGEVPLDDREDTVKLMEKKNDIILVANCKAAGVGLSVKNIQNIVFAMSGKAETKIIQGIGRGVRLHKNKDYLTLYDFHHNLKYSKRHFKQRIKLYKEHYKKDISKKVKEILI